MTWRGVLDVCEERMRQRCDAACDRVGTVVFVVGRLIEGDIFLVAPGSGD